jgi:hypothetical protein
MSSVNEKYLSEAIPQSIVKNTSIMSLARSLETCEESIKGLASMKDAMKSCPEKSVTDPYYAFLEDRQLVRLQIKKRLADLLQKDLPEKNDKVILQKSSKPPRALEKTSSKINLWTCGACGRKGHTLRSALCPKKRGSSSSAAAAAAADPVSKRRSKRKADDMMMDEASKLTESNVFKKIETSSNIYIKKRKGYRKTDETFKKSVAAQSLLDLASRKPSS